MIPSGNARVCHPAVAGLAAMAACNHPALVRPGAAADLRGVYTADIDDRTADACTDFLRLRQRHVDASRTRSRRR
jgi:hypothetical protein